MKNVLSALRHLVTPGVILAVISTLGFLVAFVFFYPGYRSADSDWQLCQALGECALDSWHPVSMTLVWKLLLQWTGGYVPAMLVLQLSMFWAAIYLIGLWVWGRTRSWKLAVLPFVMAFLPNVFNIIGVIWKDVHMMSALLLSVALVLHLPKKKLWIKVAGIVAVALLVGYAVSVRANAIAAVPALLVLYVSLIGWPQKHYQKALFIIAALASLVAINPIVNKISGPVISSSTVTMYAYDIVNILPSHKLASESPREIRQTLVKLSECSVLNNNKTILAFWACASQDDVKKGLSNNHQDILKGYWREVVGRYPAQYLVQKAETYGQFVFSDHGRLAWFGGGDMFNDREAEFSRVDSSISKSFRSLNQSYVEDFGYKHFSFIYKPWFWLMIGIGLMLYARRLPRYKAWVYGLSASAVLYILSYAPASVTPDYRYIYWSVIATLLACLIAAVDIYSAGKTKKKPKEKTKDD